MGFKSPQDKQDAEKNFKQSRQLVKAHNSKPSNYKVKLGKFAHVVRDSLSFEPHMESVIEPRAFLFQNSAKLKKMRLGMKKARVNKGRRLKSAPKFNITRHRGALLRAQNRAKGRGKRQTDALQSLLALFQSFGGGLGGLGNLGSLGQGFDLSQIFAGGGATNGLSSLFGGGGSLPNPFGGGGGGLIPTQRPVSPTRKPSDRTDTTDNTGSLSPATLDWRQHNYVRSVKDQVITNSPNTHLIAMKQFIIFSGHLWKLLHI